MAKDDIKNYCSMCGIEIPKGCTTCDECQKLKDDLDKKKKWDL